MSQEPYVNVIHFYLTLQYFYLMCICGQTAHSLLTLCHTYFCTMVPDGAPQHSQVANRNIPPHGNHGDPPPDTITHTKYPATGSVRPDIAAIPCES